MNKLVAKTRLRSQLRGRAHCLASVFIIALAFHAAVAGGDEPIAKFAVLSEPEQRAYLRASLQEFRERISNIHARTVQSAKNIEFDPVSKKIGDRVLMQTSEEQFDVRRIGDSYRIVVQSESKDRPGEMTPPVTQCFDARIGIGRNLGENQPGRLTGMITPKYLLSASDNCVFHQYLGDDEKTISNPSWYFLDSYEKARVTRVDPETRTAEVSFPSPDIRPGQVGSCTVLFDLSKRALIVGFTIDRAKTNEDQPIPSYSYRFKAKDIVELDGVWIPREFEVHAWSPNPPANSITVHTIKISNLELGRLTSEDLRIDFPPGTEVHDAIRKTTYIVGEK